MPVETIHGPAEWRGSQLYLTETKQVVAYIGQSPSGESPRRVMPTSGWSFIAYAGEPSWPYSMRPHFPSWDDLQYISVADAKLSAERLCAEEVVALAEHKEWVEAYKAKEERRKAEKDEVSNKAIDEILADLDAVSPAAPAPSPNSYKRLISYYFGKR